MIVYTLYGVYNCGVVGYLYWVMLFSAQRMGNFVFLWFWNLRVKFCFLEISWGLLDWALVFFVLNCVIFSSKKTGKGNRPGKGGNCFYKSVGLGFKTPIEASEGM